MTSGSPSSRPEFPPLLPVGRHPLTLDEIRALCVKGFPRSITRNALMDALENAAARLSDAGIVGELWVNGSFLTQKTDPADLDVVLRIQGALYDNGTTAQRDAIDWFTSDLKQGLHIDSYCFVEYPEGHSQYWQGVANNAYWMRQWSFSRDNELKGIGVIILPY